VVALMSINLAPGSGTSGQTGAAAMFANVAGSYLWAGTAVGARSGSFFKILPVGSAGATPSMPVGTGVLLMDAGTPSSIFWLMPTYIAYYTSSAGDGGRLYSRSDGQDLVSCSWCGDADRVHHLSRSASRRPASSSCIGVHQPVALPTLLTVFTICASAEIASRLRGGSGAFRWVRALPWKKSDHAGHSTFAGDAGILRRPAD